MQEYSGGSISELLNMADKKMYYAKKTGRNKVEIQDVPNNQR